MALSAYCVPKHIDEDLKVFKKYMEQCYVAYDENVELGFDLDKTIKNIKILVILFFIIFLLTFYYKMILFWTFQL